MQIQEGFTRHECLGEMVMEEICHLSREEQAAILSGLIETLESTVARLRKENENGRVVEGGAVEQHH